MKMKGTQYTSGILPTIEVCVTWSRNNYHLIWRHRNIFHGD